MVNRNNYYTEFMFLVVIVCITLISTILSNKIFNFPLVFKTSLLFFFKFMNKFYTLYNLYHVYTQIATNTMTTRNMNSMQFLHSLQTYPYIQYFYILLSKP